MTLLRKIFQAFTKKERILFLSITAIAIFSGIVLLSLMFRAATTPIPTSGGEYTEGFVGQPVYANPVIASTDVDKSLVHLLFENLGNLADTITTSSDGRTWKVRLKEKLHWQDNTKLTSDDVIFTVLKIQDHESRSPLFDSWQGVAVQRLSELEIQFSIINPYAFFPDTLANLYVLPKHIFAEVPPANWHLSTYNLKPLGSGPFIFKAYDQRPDGFITTYALSPWKEYPQDTALIQNFNLMFFSQKSDLIDAFNSGIVDGLAGLEPQDIAEIKRPHEILRYDIPNYYAVFFNQGKNAALQDAAVRKALSDSTPRENLVESALLGMGRTAHGPIPDSSPYYFLNAVATSSATSTALSIASPAGTLDAAGWKLDSSGIRKKTSKKSTTTLELDFTVPDLPFLTKTAALLKTAWESLGAKVTITAIPVPNIAAQAIKNRDYEALLFGNVLMKSYDLFSFWHSSQRFDPGLNLGLYNNKKADSLIESIRQNINQKSREGQLRDLQKTIINDYPAVFLYSTDYLYISANNVHGVDARPITEPADRFSSARYWYVKTARVLK